MRHGQDKNRQTKKDGDHETPSHILELPAYRIRHSSFERFQCHAALRTISWSFLPHFGVHRTGENGIQGDLLGLSWGLQKPLSAMLTTKIKHLIPALAAKSGGFLHLHATDRIDCHSAKPW
jgi:hypothetical protein